MPSGIACLAFQTSEWQLHSGMAYLAMIGYPLLGVHPRMSVVRPIMIVTTVTAWIDSLIIKHQHTGYLVGLPWYVVMQSVIVS